MRTRLLMLLCWFEQISGAHWTVLAHLTRDFHPLRVSQITPIACDGSRPHGAASTLGLWLGKRIIILVCGSSPQARHGLLCAERRLTPSLPSQSWVMAGLLPHGSPLGPHTKRIQWTYSIPGLSPARTDAPGRVRPCRLAAASKCVSI